MDKQTQLNTIKATIQKISDTKTAYIKEQSRLIQNKYNKARRDNHISWGTEAYKESKKDEEQEIEELKVMVFNLNRSELETLLKDAQELEEQLGLRQSIGHDISLLKDLYKRGAV